VKILENILIFFVKVYQNAISPLLGANCRFTPTCSQYSIEAIREWGPFKGTWLAVKRISKCQPWGSHGWDPVPKKTEKTNEKI
jgi:putative membrane protein insertion efficiency factor